MKILIKRIVFVVLALGLTGMSQLALAETRDLTKDEIMATFSDKTARGKHAKKDKRTMVYFAPDGTYKAKRLDERDSSEGKWYANDENLLCMEKGGDTRCRRVVDKNGKINKYKGTKLESLSGIIQSSRMATSYKDSI